MVLGPISDGAQLRQDRAPFRPLDGLKENGPQLHILSQSDLDQSDRSRVSNAPDRHPLHIFAHKCGTKDQIVGSERETSATWNSIALGTKIRKVRRLAIEAGFEGIQDEGPNAPVNYRFRHTALSGMLMLGIDVSTVAEMTRTSANQICKTYQHLLDSHLARAADIFLTKRRKA